MTKSRRKKWQESGKDNKTAVMGLLERDGKARLEVIGERSIKEVIRENVDKSATIYTDSHAGYELLGIEYVAHESVNHSIQEYRSDAALLF